MVKFKSNKKMKILYILLAVIFFSCKTENKQKVVYADAIIKTNDTVVIDFEAFNEAKFIGKTYQYLDECNEFKDCRYGGFELLPECGEKKIDIVKIYPNGSENPQLLLLIENEENGKNKITDILNLSKENLLKTGENFVLISDRYINSGKTINKPIAAITRIESEKEYFTAIHKVWSVDCKSGKFVEISTKNIKVENEEYYGI